MAQYLIQETTLEAIADAIRTKTGSEEDIRVADMASLIESISAGGGSADVRYVTFKNYDGTDIGIKPVAVGDDCRYIFGTPTKPSTAQYSYSHNGWSATQGGAVDSNALKAINEDKTLYATFKATVRTYTITYYDSDGTTVLKTETLAYGAMPSYTPTKEGHSFDGWTPALATVTGNVSYTAAWKAKATLNDYTWAELDAMSLEECMANFSIGDKKTVEFVYTSSGGKGTRNFTLVGFEADDLADGSGKAKMSFISDYVGASAYWGTNLSSIYWPDCRYKKEFLDKFDAWSAKSTDHAALNSVIKTVKKKYVASDNSSTNPTYATIDEKYWMPAASELGFRGKSGVCDEGNCYSAFNDKTVVEALGGMTAYGSMATRSIYPTYYNFGKFIVNKGTLETIKQSDTTTRMMSVGFCI